MNYYEFVSDRYATVMIEQHFNGLFLNHIPLMRKLKWREIAGFKILMGDIAQRHDEMLLFPVTRITSYNVCYTKLLRKTRFGVKVGVAYGT